MSLEVSAVQFVGHVRIHGQHVDGVNVDRARKQGWRLRVEGPAVLVQKVSTGEVCDVPMTFVRAIHRRPKAVEKAPEPKPEAPKETQATGFAEDVTVGEPQPKKQPPKKRRKKGHNR